MIARHLFLLLFFGVFVSACTGSTPNNPYPAESGGAVLYSSFSERPKHLDPARSYSENEYVFIGQILEPPLQYHYLKRPYQLEPLTAAAMPNVEHFDAAMRPLPENAAGVAFSRYTIRIRPGIHYAPHPAFARTASGQLRYHALDAASLGRIDQLSDFRMTATRELVADDYVYQIKRLASPRLNSPVFGMMKEYIVGLDELGRVLAALPASRWQGSYIDLSPFALSGVKSLDKYTYQVTLKGHYPQFRYWLAMPFFAPTPPEVDAFYAQPGLVAKNISLNTYPVGTGAYYLAVNDPNRRMVLRKNPRFHGDIYPVEGEPEDAARGLLQDKGKPLPFIDEVVYSLEKESIPYWNKFLQGYYDISGISSENFDKAVQISPSGEPDLSVELRSQGIRLSTSVLPSSSYYGFNMLDPVVGGNSERARKLRQAISIALDVEEYISIFLNGRGIAAQGPIPPGLFGYQEGAAGLNPVVYRLVNGHSERRSIAEARQLLAEAGYPRGRDRTTGRPLVLYFDVAGGGPEDKAVFDWMRKQFQKLNIDLVIRQTDYNRFQDKMSRGQAQIFQWGWNADYPDPENFLFLLYGPNSKAEAHGENAANYRNPAFDALFEQMMILPNGPQRQAVIDQMLAIVRQDAPWIFGVHPRSMALYHGWVHNAKPNPMAHNRLKYLRLDPAARAAARTSWNQPAMWPLPLLLGGLLILAWPVLRLRQRRRSRTAFEDFS